MLPFLLRGVLSGAMRECRLQGADPLDPLAALIDPAGLAPALQATGTASLRQRKLPAQHTLGLELDWLCCVICSGGKWSANWRCVDMLHRRQPQAA